MPLGRCSSNGPIGSQGGGLSVEGPQAQATFNLQPAALAWLPDRPGSSASFLLQGWQLDRFKPCERPSAVLLGQPAELGKSTRLHLSPLMHALMSSTSASSLFLLELNNPQFPYSTAISRTPKHGASLPLETIISFTVEPRNHSAPILRAVRDYGSFCDRLTRSAVGSDRATRRNQRCSPRTIRRTWSPSTRLLPTTSSMPLREDCSRKPPVLGTPRRHSRFPLTTRTQCVAWEERACWPTKQTPTSHNG